VRPSAKKANIVKCIQVLKRTQAHSRTQVRSIKIHACSDVQVFLRVLVLYVVSPQSTSSSNGAPRKSGSELMTVERELVQDRAAVRVTLVSMRDCTVELVETFNKELFLPPEILE
jgi:hypothetical protein